MDDIVHTKNRYSDGHEDDTSNDELNRELKEPKIATNECAANSIVLHIWKGRNFKYVVGKYGYLSVDNTTNPAGHTPDTILFASATNK